MKRKISVFLFAAVLISCCIVPVKAAETETAGYLNVLDFGADAESGVNSQVPTVNVACPFTYTLPSTYTLQWIDVVFSYRLSGTVSVNWAYGSSSTALTVEKIDGNIYRAYGSITSANISTFSLQFTTNPANRITIEVLRVGRGSYSLNNVTGYCSISAANYSSTISYNPDDDSNMRSWAGASDVNLRAVQLELWSASWTKFDYLDFYLTLQLNSIQSISVMMVDGTGYSDVSVPFEVTYLSSTAFDDSYFDFVIRLDLRGLDRSGSYYPRILIDASCDFDTTSMVSVNSIYGLQYIESGSTILIWFQTIVAAVKNNTSELKAQLWNLRQETISNFSGLTSSLTGFFSDLNTKIDDAKFAIVEAILNGDGSLDESGQEFIDDVSTQATELAEIVEVMDSVEKPDIDTVDVSVDSYVSPDDLSTLTSPMLVFVSGDLFGPMVVMSILMATVSYVLYGKK